MSDLLSIGSSGIYSYQRALSTVANNIANVGTDGYNRQDVAIASGQPRDIGSGFIGTGSRFDGVKRQYDAFLESNLRNSTSDLEGQGPLVQFANRVVDLLANQNVGLTSSLNAFFASARDLSTAPASVVVRGNFLREAGSVSSSFGQLASQMVDMDREVRASVDVTTQKINALAEQIALVNKQLFRKSSVDTQPPELLDQRDRLLRDLSKLVRISTSFSQNGQATVSLNGTLDPNNGAILVENDTAHRLIMRFDGGTGRVEMSLPFAPEPRPKIITGITGGELGGLLSIRGQVLDPTLAKLNELAVALADEVNTLHQQGIDARGNTGKALFSVSGASKDAALNIKTTITDPQEVATAAPFRVVSNELNVGTAKASWAFTPEAINSPPTLQSLFPVREGMPGTDLRISVGSLTPITTLSAGTQNAVISFDSGEAWPQLITRDGRHLLGKTLTAAQQALLFEHPSIEPGARYDTTYLNSTKPENAYLKSSYFIGAKASAVIAPAFAIGSDAKGEINSRSVSGGNISSVQINAGEVLLNGKPMPAYNNSSAPAVKTLDDLASWFNQNTGTTGVAAQVVDTEPTGHKKLVLTAAATGQSVKLTASRETLNELGFSLPDDLLVPNEQMPVAAYLQGQFVPATPPYAAFGLAPKQLLLNNIDLAPGAALPTTTNPDEVAAWLNTKTAQTGVVASVVQQTFQEGLQQVQRKSLVLTSTDASKDVRLSFGPDASNPSVLGQLGLRTSLYWEGTASDDLIVLANASASTTIGVSARYTQQDFSRIDALRQSPFNIKIGSDGTYSIIDVKTQTELAKRDFDPHQSFIEYRGFRVQFNGVPLAGDMFRIDGNANGVGDNANIKAIAELEFKIRPNGFSLTDAYIAHTSRMGNLARQASIAQEALAVVHQQSVQARESAVGVNLDEEAANLIRFQQAYQANAKVMQTSTVLFDALINLR